MAASVADGRSRPEAFGAGLSRPGAASLAVAAFPVIAGARLLSRPSPVLYGDDALIGIAARSFPQTLGPYSRDGFHHPGPALFYLLAPLSGSSRGLYLGALVINVVALLAIVVIIRRAGTPSAALWAAAVLDVFVLCLGPSTFISFWNPYLVILPMALFAVLWAADLWAWAMVVGSFCIQTHLSTAPVVLVVLLWTLRRGRPSLPPDGRSWIHAAGLVVSVAMWAPPLIELHNLGAIWRFFAVRHSPAGPIGLLVLGAAAVIAPCPRRFGSRLAVAGLALGAVGGLSMLFADGPVLRYFVVWLGVAPLALSLAWASTRRRGATLLGSAAAVTVGIVALTMTPVDGANGDGPWPAADHSDRALTVSDTAAFDRAAQAAVGRSRQAVLHFDTPGLWPYAAGIVWALDERGITTSVPGWPLYFPARRSAGVHLGLYPAEGPHPGTVIAAVDGTVLVTQSH